MWVLSGYLLKAGQKFFQFLFTFTVCFSFFNIVDIGYVIPNNYEANHTHALVRCAQVIINARCIKRDLSFLSVLWLKLHLIWR